MIIIIIKLIIIHSLIIIIILLLYNGLSHHNSYYDLRLLVLLASNFAALLQFSPGIFLRKLDGFDTCPSSNNVIHDIVVIL